MSKKLKVNYSTLKKPTASMHNDNYRENHTENVHKYIFCFHL